MVPPPLQKKKKRKAKNKQICHNTSLEQRAQHDFNPVLLQRQSKAETRLT